MSETTVVRYEVRPGAVEENQRLVEQVLAELADEDPGGLRYAAFQLADGVTFVHVAVVEGDDNALSRSRAFAAFQQGIGDWVAEPPEPADATLIGSYRFLT